MAPSKNKSNANKYPTARGKLHAEEDGKVTLVTLIAMLALVVLCGFIGNVGHAVTQKMEVQNAADAAALESAQWMARGMNAITATNHMIGEATAILAVIEAIGGPEAIYGEPFYPNQSKSLDKVIESLQPTAPMKGPPNYVPPGFGPADKKIVDLILKFVTPKSEENRKHRAFATIYDSKITLKGQVIKLLMLKSFANIGFLVPPPWGYLTAIPALATHLYGTGELILVAKEWIILEAFERFLTLGATKRVIKVFNEALANKLIPMLAKHGDFVAGNLGGRGRPGQNTGNNSGEAKRSIVNHAIDRTMINFGDRYNVKAFVFPAPKNLRLPVDRELKPSLKAGKKLKAWGKDNALIDSQGVGFIQMLEMKGKINDAKREIQQRRNEIQTDVVELIQVEADIDVLLKRNDLTAKQRQELNKEKEAIAESRKRFEEKLKVLDEKMKEIRKKESDLAKLQGQLDKLDKKSGNLTTRHINKKLVKKLINQDEERQTQWVRATYPYVDAFRAGLLSNMKSQLKRSEAAKHFEKWTNRFTIIKSWELRSGYRYQQSQGSEAYWRRSQDNRLSMYVMKGTYGSAGSRPKKGHQTWTKDTKAGKREAEKIFTVLGVAHRDFEPHFSPLVYPQANKLGITTFAQAIFYNANTQEPGEEGSKPGKSQLDVGWDTLNWSPDTPTPEWGSKPSEAKGRWPWQMFSAAESLESAAVQLNWQAKLMPVRQSRFNEATENVDPIHLVLHGKAQAKLVGIRALGFFDDLVTH